MDLSDGGEASAVKPLDDPELPQRSRAIERSLHDSRHELLELIVVPGTRQARMAHVVVEVEVPVVHPYGVPLAGNPGELLPIARDKSLSWADNRSYL
jgi:hypothetical protein